MSPGQKEGLPDYLRPGLKLLLVGINPGLRSAEVGHHFAGPGNRFWNLLHDAGITPHRLTYQEDARLVDFGVGLTNIAARATRSSSDLGREDFSRGSRTLAKKISRFEPKGVAFVGITGSNVHLESPGAAKSFDVGDSPFRSRAPRSSCFPTPAVGMPTTRTETCCIIGATSRSG
jgi:hypothetical protein